jgi:transcriptional regulator with XRE-family HTH domain
MIPVENHGLIIRELSKLQNLNVREAARKISRSIGWLSEIENGTGTARLTGQEFDRIVAALDGLAHKPMFRTWVANHKNQERIHKTFDGAVLKFIRLKKGFSLQEAANLAGISRSHLCNLETGGRPMTLRLRYRIMKAYGYNPTSFKNLATDPVRSKVVPSAYKFRILLRSMTAEQAEKIFSTALNPNL